MNKTDSPHDSVILSIEKIIDLIRAVRNDLIKAFLNDETLNAHFQTQYKKPLSDIKREFCKRDLKELLITPVDLVHYAGLINYIKETGTASVTEKNDHYFYSDIDKIISKYSI
jgi:hypothetical protein